MRLREKYAAGNPANEGGCSADSPFSSGRIGSLTDEDLLRLSCPVTYDGIRFETETYRSGKKHIKKTRYKENPYGKIIGRHDRAQIYTKGQRTGHNVPLCHKYRLEGQCNIRR